MHRVGTAKTRQRLRIGLAVGVCESVAQWGRFSRTTHHRLPRQSGHDGKIVFEGIAVATQESMCIAQVNACDIGGGAAKVAWDLLHAYRARGFNTSLRVGRKYSVHQDVTVISNDTRLKSNSALQRWALLRERAEEKHFPMAAWWARVAGALVDPIFTLQMHYGIEDFRFSGTWRLLSNGAWRPDILHCHNLHSKYFDLRALPWLSRQVPVVLTLHDAWLLSGHCAHSFSCERWQVGCGQCPDLSIYPSIQNDATAYNWRRKKKIYRNSRLYVATPSQWLMDKVRASMLAPALIEAKVIPNGVDLSVYHPEDKQLARSALALPGNAVVLLAAGLRLDQNVFKDYAMMCAVAARIAERLKSGPKVVFLTLGTESRLDQVGNATLISAPYETNAQAVARYYQAADVYIHAAKADTFPNAILEALACGTPVAATCTGGIPEQVKALMLPRPVMFGVRRIDCHKLDTATGILVEPGDSEGMSEALAQALNPKDAQILTALSSNAARDAKARFDLEKQADEYVRWYCAILQHRGRGQHP